MTQDIHPSGPRNNPWRNHSQREARLAESNVPIRRHLVAGTLHRRRSHRPGILSLCRIRARIHTSAPRLQYRVRYFRPVHQRHAASHRLGHHEVGQVTVVKIVDFSYKLASAFLEDAVHAAPPSQQYKTAPPGVLTREHRSGPRSSHPASLSPHDSLNRIGSASPLSQPVLRCKRRSQLPRDRTPVRPHVLHALPCRYGEGDVNAVADGTDAPAWNTLRAAE